VGESCETRERLLEPPDDEPGANPRLCDWAPTEHTKTAYLFVLWPSALLRRSLNHQKAKTMNPNPSKQSIIGVDLHPDVFSAAALAPQGRDLGRAITAWAQDRLPVAKIEN
jgi:hypothetical protein